LAERKLALMRKTYASLFLGVSVVRCTVLIRLCRAALAEQFAAVATQKQLGEQNDVAPMKTTVLNLDGK